MKTQKSTTAISLIAALFFVALPFGSANAGEVLTAQDHVKIAKYHEALLQEAQIKLTEHKAALENYESRSNLYGRGGQDFKSHETANIREYEKIVAENKAQVELHHKLAAENPAQQFAGDISEIQAN